MKILMQAERHCISMLLIHCLYIIDRSVKSINPSINDDYLIDLINMMDCEDQFEGHQLVIMSLEYWGNSKVHKLDNNIDSSNSRQKQIERIENKMHDQLYTSIELVSVQINRIESRI